MQIHSKASKSPTISIVIPTLNEEKYLPQLLNSIQDQTYKDYEVIVADANSRDNTRRIAEEYGAKVVPGGKIAQGRNNGAKSALGKYIFFFDADVELPENFLEKVVSEMRERELDVATCDRKPMSKYRSDKVLYDTTNVFFRIFALLGKAQAAGFATFIKKVLFEEIEGYDETLVMGEDLEMSERAGRSGKFGVLDSVVIPFSTRRIEKEGRTNYLVKITFFMLYRNFYKEIDKEILRYDFGEHDKEKEKMFEVRLEKLKYDLDRMYRTLSVHPENKKPKDVVKVKRDLKTLLESFRTSFESNKTKQS